MRTFLVVALGSLALTGLMIFAAVKVDREAKTRPPATPRTTLSEASRRILFQDLSSDDADRAAVFQSIIATHYRCDRVLRAVSPVSGKWRISCSPGYGYTIFFDQDGKIIQFDRD